jgi:hypothetical protein
MRAFALRSIALHIALVTAAVLSGCGEADGPVELETAEGALVKGGDRPNDTCLRRNKNGTTTTGACSVVCKDLTLYEPNTDAEVDAVSSNGGVCNEAIKRTPVLDPVRGGVIVIVR